MFELSFSAWRDSMNLTLEKNTTWWRITACSYWHYFKGTKDFQFDSYFNPIELSDIVSDWYATWELVSWNWIYIIPHNIHDIFHSIWSERDENIQRRLDILWKLIEQYNQLLNSNKFVKDNIDWLCKLDLTVNQ